jgi:two-component system, NarL family, sensor kinase
LKRARHQPSRPSPPGDGQPGGATPDEPPHNLSELRSRLAEAEGTLRAIRTGEVDAVVIAGEKGPQVFTLEGAEHAYRVLIESMNEGALTLTTDGTVLYANQCFARMVKCPLEQVTGSSFRRFLSTADRASLRLLVKRAAKAGSKIQVHLHAGDGSQLPVQISLRSLARKGPTRATIGMVVTDMTPARQTEELLRTLTHRVVQAQEAERRRLALELHDHITQLVCATLFRSQTLVNQLSAHEDALKQEAITLSEMLGQAAKEVERISHGLRPGVLDELGLAAVLRNTTREFAERTGVSVNLTCVPLPARLPADTELTLYRILQEALKNVERHARARHVTVRLTKSAAVIKLVIHDDGIGFDPEHHPTLGKGKAGLGLLSMRERALYSGGTLKVKSVRRAGLAKAGTAIEVRVPLGGGHPIAKPPVCANMVIGQTSSFPELVRQPSTRQIP